MNLLLAHLPALQGRTSIQSLDSDRDYILGRNPLLCDIAFPIPRISRVHARLSYDDTIGLWAVTDLGSTYGTYVGPITGASLAPGPRLAPNIPTILNPGTGFALADPDGVFYSVSREEGP